MSDLINVQGAENPDRSGDIIFVHGLRGNPREYWQRDGRPDTFWPAWLGKEKEFADIGVWSLGYEVEASGWKGVAMPLYVQANSALDLLQQSHIGQVPIVFVTHSLGGLLVKQMLRNGKELRQKAWQRIARQTRGVVFISTPHSGSDLATYISYLGWLLRSTVAVEDLKANAPRLAEINTWYRENAGFERDDELHIRTLVYYEERKTRWGFKLLGATVVDRTSAEPGIKGVIPVGLNFDHSTIHKPESTNSQLYKGVRNFIRECLFADFRLAHQPI